MKTTRRWHCWFMAGIGLGLAALTGCQTNIAGMTLPSGHYLQHPPQYFVPSPAFPLTRELAHMEEQSALPGPGAPVVSVPLPPQVPPGPPPVPAPIPVPAPAPMP
jgi:hypothetical protein